MAKSESVKLQKLRRTLTLDKVQDLLEDARGEAASSRKVLHSTFAKAYVWYQHALDLKGTVNDSYLEDTFRAETPPITPRKGVSEYSRVVKLAFSMSGHDVERKNPGSIVDAFTSLLNHSGSRAG